MLYSELSPTDKEALWQAFDKRFPLGLSKEFLLKEARLSKRVRLEASWKDIFTQLQEHPREFNRLLRTAVEMRPDDSNLVEMVEILCPPAPVGWFAAVASVVCMGIVASLAVPSEAPSNHNAFARAEQTQADLAALERFEQDSYTQEVTSAIVEDIQHDEPILLPDAGEEEKHPGTASQLEESAPLSPLLTRSIREHNTAVIQTPSRCSIEGSGERIGYWYAGAEPPEVDNGWTVIPRGTNVRVDYPEKHNGYNAKSPVSCVLFANMRVPVKEDPILVAGDKYWVPLYSVPRG